VETSISLTWDCSDPDGDDLSFSIYFGTDPNPTIIEPNYSATLYNLPILENNTIYYWKIFAADIIGDSTNSAVWCFTILDSVVTCPATISDFDGNVYKSLLVTSAG